MTKVIILGEQPKEERKVKPIEFTHTLTDEFRIHGDCVEPKLWPTIDLITADYRGTGKALFYAHDGTRVGGVFYIGHFNDGVVE